MEVIADHVVAIATSGLLNRPARPIAEGGTEESRFAALRRSIAANPPDETYVAEADDRTSDRWS